MKLIGERNAVAIGIVDDFVSEFILFDRRTGIVEMDREGYAPSMAPDGRYLAFVRPGTRNRREDDNLASRVEVADLKRATISTLGQPVVHAEEFGDASVVGDIRWDGNAAFRFNANSGRHLLEVRVVERGGRFLPSVRIVSSSVE